MTTYAPRMLDPDNSIPRAIPATGSDATQTGHTPDWVPSQYQGEWTAQNPPLGGNPSLLHREPGTWQAHDGTMYVNPSGNRASDILANVTRSQWGDYLRSFAPIEERLMNETTYNNPNILPQALNEGESAINTQFDVAQGMAKRNMQRYGVHADARQLNNMDQVESMGRTAAIVGAANNIRQRLNDRNMAIASGGIPNASRSYGGPTGGGSQ